MYWFSKEFLLFLSIRIVALMCFLDAFDMVDHSVLFSKLIDRGLPLPTVHFLLNVCWNGCV